jgi:preprotein translocase subunit SecE
VFCCIILLMGNIVSFLRDVRVELSKVVWPKKAQVIKLTLTVFIISGIVALYVGVLDYSFVRILEVVIAR